MRFPVWRWLPLFKGSLSKLTYWTRLSLDTVLCSFYPRPLNFMFLRMINTVKCVKYETFPYSSVESKSQRCLLWHKQPLQKNIIEHTETCVKPAQDKPNHSCAGTSLLYKIMLIKWINQDTTGSFLTWHWVANEHDLPGTRATKKPPQKEDSWKTWAKVPGSSEDLHWSLSCSVFCEWRQWVLHWHLASAYALWLGLQSTWAYLVLLKGTITNQFREEMIMLSVIECMLYSLT